MTVGVAQDLPMGALTVTFAVRRYNIPDAVVLSLVTSSVMLGMKLAQLSMLKHWYTAQSQLCAAASPHSVGFAASAAGGIRSPIGRQSSATTR